MSDLLQRNRARLIVQSSVSASESATAAGVVPDESWSAGDAIPGQIRSRKQNGWQVTSTIDNARPLDDHVGEILARLEPADPKRLRDLDCTIRVYCFVYHHDRPSLSLSATSVARIAVIGAELDIDAFALPSQDELEAMDL